MRPLHIRFQVISFAIIKRNIFHFAKTAIHIMQFLRKHIHLNRNGNTKCNETHGIYKQTASCNETHLNNQIVLIWSIFQHLLVNIECAVHGEYAHCNSLR